MNNTHGKPTGNGTKSEDGFSLFAYIGYLTQTLILNIINQHSKYIYVSQILHFETKIALRFVQVASASVHVLLRRAHGMGDKQFVYAVRPVVSTSKVC